MTNTLKSKIFYQSLLRRPNTFITAVLGQKINTIYRSDYCTHLHLNIIYHFNFMQAKVKQHVSPLIDWSLECSLPLGLDETPP